MEIKRTFIVMLLPVLLLTGCGKHSRNDDSIIRTEESHTYEGYPVVYVTPDVSPQGLLSAYELMEVPNSQNVAIRPCLKIGEMPDWGIFLCQARRFFAGGLSPGKENQRSPDGIRCPETAFCQFSNKA